MKIDFLRTYFDLNKNFILNNNYTLHYKIASLILTLIPFTLITGPFLPDLFLSIIAIYFLSISIIYKLKDSYKSKLVVFFLFFYICILFSGLSSEYPYESLVGFNGPIFYFRYLFFVLGVLYLLTKHPDLIKLFTLNLAFILVFTILDGYIQWLVGSNIFGFQSPSSRVTGIFNNEEVLGHFLSHVIPLCLGLFIYIYGSGNKFTISYMVFLVIATILIFITNDRAGFLKIFQFTLLLIFLSNNFKFIRLISFIFSIFIIFLILIYSNNSMDRYKLTYENVTSTAIPYMPWTPVHDKHYSLTIKMFKEKPIYGNGPQFFRLSCLKNSKYIDGCTNHPHNYYFQTLSELGIVGVFFLFLGFFYVLFILFKQFINIWFIKKNSKRMPDYLVVLYSLIFIYLWPLIPHQSFYNNWLNVIIFLPIGFILYLIKNKEHI